MRDIHITYLILPDPELGVPTAALSVDFVVVHGFAFSFGSFFLWVFYSHLSPCFPFTFNLHCGRSPILMRRDSCEPLCFLASKRFRPGRVGGNPVRLCALETQEGGSPRSWALEPEPEEESVATPALRSSAVTL